MKKVYLILEIREEGVLTDVTLSSTGITTYPISGSVVGIYVDEFEAEFDAIREVEKLFGSPKNRTKTFTILPIYKVTK